MTLYKTSAKKVRNIIDGLKKTNDNEDLVYTNLAVKNLIKMPLENRVDPVVLRERGGKIMMIMMVAVARYFDGS